MYGNEKCAVSWHADSSLEHYSTIAVYHFHRPPQDSDTDTSTRNSKTISDDSVVVKSKKRKRNKATQDNSIETHGAECKQVPQPQQQSTPWRIAMRVVHDVQGPTASKKKETGSSGQAVEEGMASAPPVAVPLPSEWSYYMLDDFNHHHQHAVLPGDTDRFASTHRVSRTEGHCFQYIRAKCLSALQVRGSISLDIECMLT